VVPPGGHREGSGRTPLQLVTSRLSKPAAIPSMSRSRRVPRLSTDLTSIWKALLLSTTLLAGARILRSSRSPIARLTDVPVAGALFREQLSWQPIRTGFRGRVTSTLMDVIRRGWIHAPVLSRWLRTIQPT